MHPLNIILNIVLSMIWKHFQDIKIGWCINNGIENAWCINNGVLFYSLFVHHFLFPYLLYIFPLRFQVAYFSWLIYERACITKSEVFITQEAVYIIFILCSVSAWHPCKLQIKIMPQVKDAIIFNVQCLSIHKQNEKKIVLFLSLKLTTSVSVSAYSIFAK